jgi:biotin carboxylase
MSQGPAFAFGRIAIVNRGEPAMRLINAAREWNAEGRPALRVIAVYTAADRHATFVREAGEVLIGTRAYSSSISLSGACSEERHDVVGSGVLYVTLRSMAIR